MKPKKVYAYLAEDKEEDFYHADSKEEAVREALEDGQYDDTCAVEVFEVSYKSLGQYRLTEKLEKVKPKKGAKNG